VVTADRFWDERVDEVTGALETLTDALDRADDLGVVLQTVCEQVVRVVPGADLASVTLDRDGRPDTAASTDQRAVEIDKGQYEVGDGPCLQAARSGKIVRVDVDPAKDLWPEFNESARRLGIGSYLAAPLTVDAGLAGALNLFGFGPHGFREAEEKLLELYSTVVETTLRATRRYLHARELTTQLQGALATRSQIDQAKGILMAAHGISADEAFQKLVEQSQRENEKLHAVAARFVAEASRNAVASQISVEESFDRELTLRGREVPAQVLPRSDSA